jgi:nicotinate dehydrogenase large molybdopterin subunit
MEYTVIGKSYPRHDAILQVTGRSVYADDIVRPGMLHAKILRSAHAHAIIKAIDCSLAASIPGVRAIVTAQDVPHKRYGFTHQDQPVLADDKVRFLGDAVAALAADSVQIAEEALDKIRVEYEPLPGVFDPISAMAPHAPLIHTGSNIVSHIKIRSGDIEQGWRDSDCIIEETITTPMIEHAMIEPHAAVAEIDHQGVLVVWASVQRPFTIAADLAKILTKPLNGIRVIATAIGGGFGGKNEITFEPLISLLAMKSGRPVKLVYTREDEFQASTVRHPYITKYKTGVMNDGTLVVRQVEIISDCGAYVSWGESTLTKAAVHAAGPYRIPHVATDGYLVYTNNPVGGAMRGFGVTQLGFAYEVHMDTIAAELHINPVELRLKNLFYDNCVLPTGQQIELVTVRETLAKALHLAGKGEEDKS